jgi:diguanylate cyclase (GGDEF)-like protein/PAS domain S-box-containing protein
MRFSANEQTLPRLHLIGTLAIVVLLTLTLGGYFSWRSEQDHRLSLAHLAQTTQTQQQARLKAEMESAASFLEFTRSRTEDVLRKSLREKVDIAWQVAQAIYTQESPRKSATDVKRLIVEAMRQARFYEGRGYYFIDDMQGQFILLPTAPQLEGKTNLDNRDDNGHFIMRGLIDAARQPSGQGFSRYRWYMPDNPKVMADKLAYVRYFSPYDWLIGTGDYTYKWEQLQRQEVIDRLRALRFGQSGYIGLIDRNGRSLLSPADPTLEGQSVQNMPEAQRAAVSQWLTLAQAGGGLVQFSWPDRTSGIAVSQTALVRLVEPWGWTLVAAMQDNEMQAAVLDELGQLAYSRSQRWRDLLWPLALALALGFAASYGFARWSKLLFASYHQDLIDKTQVIANSEALFRAVFDNAAVGICQVEPNGHFLKINREFCRLMGYTPDEIISPEFTFQTITLPDDLDVDMAYVNQLLSGQRDAYSMEKRYVRKDGSVIWADLAVHLVRSAGNEPLYFISVVNDISVRKLAEQNLTLAASVFSHAREGIMITDADGNIINVNDSFTRITGYGRDEALRQNPRLLKSGLQTPEYYAAMWQSIKVKGHWYGEIWNRHKNGTIFAEMQTISAVRDAQGNIAHFVSLFTDITALKEHEHQLERMAHFDALTGLPNRVMLADRLNQAMHSMLRREQLLAVAYLDLDGFKVINDQEGHEAGDRLLVAASNRMKQTLREGDTLARIGGDEFVAVLVDLNEVSACAPLLTRLLEAAAEPVEYEGKTLQVSASLGVTFYPQPEEIDADQLQRQADQAMYQAKLAGKNRYHVFDAEHDRSMRGHHESLEHIRQALDNSELVLHYQPKVNMRSGQVVGVEALIRWQHPQQGLLPPAQFLPVIENHALAVDVGEWVMHCVLTQMQVWQHAGLSLPVSLNVGAKQMQQHDFVARLQDILAAHPEISPHLLSIEVLETSALEDINGASQVIEQCRDLGVSFALDDFGTGYSSLTYLKRLPVKLLKIDQSFVRDMLDDPDDLAILQGIIGLANAFQREVIAEGVETMAHGVALLQLGCDLAQGYGIARPMPAFEVPPWVQHWQQAPTWLVKSKLSMD